MPDTEVPAAAMPGGARLLHVVWLHRSQVHDDDSDEVLLPAAGDPLSVLFLPRWPFPYSVAALSPTSPTLTGGWNGARARGPAATSARPGRMGRRRIWRRRSRTQRLRRVWRPPVQLKNGKSDLEVALPTLSRPPARTV
jgi:hypothetical protein